MKKIKEFIKAFIEEANKYSPLYFFALCVIVGLLLWVFAGYLVISQHNKISDLKKSNKSTIKQSEKVIFEQQKEIQKLKKDVVLHSIIADSSIAKANRLSKKQVILQVELSRIDSVVNEFSEVDIDRYWSKRK